MDEKEKSELLKYKLALQKIARAYEQDWGYDHPERKMVQFARDTLGSEWNSDELGEIESPFGYDRSENDE